MPAQNKAELILLIEDDAGITELVKEKLGEHGKGVAHVSTGKAAREWLGHNQPQLILLDYSLPDQSGVDLVEQLEAMPGGLPPFIVTTGAGDERVAVTMMKRGARDYLIKDHNFLETLPLVVDQVLKQIATEQKLAATERALQESEILNQAIISKSPIGISVRSSTGQLFSANAAWKKIWAIPDADVQEDMLLKRDVLEFNKRDDYLLPYQAEIRRVYEEGGHFHLPEIKTTHPRPGAAEWISQHFYALRNQDGQIDRVVILTEDITERKRAENALRESEERYHIIFEQAGDYTILLEAEDGQIPVIVDANESALEAHGYPREELIGRSISLLDPDISPARVSEIMKGIKKNGFLIFNTRHKRKDGTWLDVEVNAQLITIGNKEFYLSVERDTTERKLAEEAIRASEEKYRLLFSHNPAPMWVYDTETLAFLAVNEFAIDHYGYSREEFLSMTIRDIRPPEEVPLLYSILDTDIGPLRKVNAVKHCKKDGLIIYVDISGHEIEFEGRPAMLVLSLDITERIEAEAALREREGLYRQMFAGHTAVMLLIDPDSGLIVEANPAAVDFYGYGAEKMKQMTIQQINTLAPEKVALYRRAAVEGKQNFFLFSHRLASGEIRDVEVYTVPIHIEGRTLLYSIIHDITERKQAEDALLESEERFYKAFHASPVVMSISSLEDGIILDANAQFYNLTGWKREEAIGHKSTELRLWSDSVRQGIFTELKQTGFVHNKEIELFTKSGQTIPLLWFGDVVHINNKPCLIGSGYDLSERKQAESALSESHQRMQLLLDSTKDAIYGLDTNEQCTFANKAFLEMTGYDNLEELLGKNIHDLIHHTKEDGTPYIKSECKIYEAFQKGVGVTVNDEIFWRKDGSFFPVEYSSYPIFKDDAVKGAVVSFTDITERKRAEMTLRENENRLRTIFETSQAGIILVDPKGIITFANRSMADMFGWPLNELIGSSYPELVHPDQRQAGGEKMKQLIAKEIDSVSLERHYIRKDRSDFWGFLSGRRLEDEKGDLLSLIGIIADISQLKQAEKKLRSVLHDKEVLLRELYHRTKNNMQVISAMLNLELAEIEEESVKQALLDMDSRIRSMALVHQKLYQSKNLSSLDLKDYITDLVKLLLESYQVIPERINFKMKAESVPVLIDTAIPCGLIINEILSNTLKYAFPDNRKGNILVRLARSKDATITLEISDDGIGVPAEKDLRQSNTLGMQTIFGIASHQLGARVDLKTDRGVAWRIQFSDNQYTSRV